MEDLLGKVPHTLHGLELDITEVVQHPTGLRGRGGMGGEGRASEYVRPLKIQKKLKKCCNFVDICQMIFDDKI